MAKISEIESSTVSGNSNDSIKSSTKIQIKQFLITILNWSKHNQNKKKNHRYFFLENRFFNDEKIAQLSAVDTRFYLYLLTVASDLNQGSYILHTNLIPSYFRLRTESIQTSLSRMQSLQLLSYDKIDSLNNRIEYKRKEIEYNIKEISVSDSENNQFDPNTQNQNPITDFKIEAEIFFLARRNYSANDSHFESYMGAERMKILKALGGKKFLMDLKDNSFEVNRLSKLIKFQWELIQASEQQEVV